MTQFMKILGLVTLMSYAITSPVIAQMNNIKTVFIILMENHNWVQIKNSTSAPYINNTLLPMASYAEQYYNPPGNHPSLPNYLWLEAGTNFGIGNDDDPKSNHQGTTSHLVTQLRDAGVSWKTYQEDITGTACPLASSSRYAPKHNPFVYFDDVTNNNDPNSAFCIAHVRPYVEFATDVKNNAIAQFVFITPNLCDDMHDSCSPLKDPVKQGDTWLSNEIPKILNSSVYQNGGAIFIVWDEAENGDGPIGMIVISPFAKGGGYSNTTRYTHGSTLRTLEEIFGVPLLRDAASQADLSDMFIQNGGTAATVAGVTNGASFSGDVSPGSLASIFGANLALATASAASLPLPMLLGGVSVAVNGRPAPLIYVSPGQINFQMPYETPPGSASIVTTTSGIASPSFSFTVLPSAPGLFLSGASHAIAQNQDGTLNDSSHAAAPATILVVYLTGQGPLDNAVVTGAAAPSQPLSRATQPFSAMIGGQNAPIQFLGLTPGYVGLAQANIAVPTLSPGDYPLVITIAGVAGKAANVSVGAPASGSVTQGLR